MISNSVTRWFLPVFVVCGLSLSCAKNPPQEEIVIPELTFCSVTELSFPCEGGTASFNFTTNQEWTVTPECCFDFCGGPGGYSLSEGERADNTILTEVADLAALGLLYPAFNIPDLVRLYVTLYGGPDNVPDSVSFSGHTFWRKYVLEAFDLYPYELIGKYEGPVLILHGDKDEMVPLSYSEEAIKTYKNASLVVLEGQSHGFSADGRKLAIEYLGEFLPRLLY